MMTAAMTSSSRPTRDRRIADRQLRELQHARPAPASAARQRVDRPACVRSIAHAAQPRRPLVRSDGEQVPAEPRVAQRERDDDRERDASSRCPTAAASPRPSCAVRSRSFSQVIGASIRRSSASPFAAPRTSSIVPSVTMNGTTRSRVMSRPLIAPHSAPAATRAERGRQRTGALPQQQRDHDRAQRDDRSDRQIDAARRR